MADRVVPDWARWFLLLGIFMPAAGFFFLKDYDQQAGVWNNIMKQDVVVHFLRGQNPLVCFNESLRNLTGAPLGYETTRSHFCVKPTEIPFRNLVFVSLLIFLLGLYRHVNPEEISNKWPTEWRVFNPANAKKNKDSTPDFTGESVSKRPSDPDDSG
jgi:hypothetical protein